MRWCALWALSAVAAAAFAQSGLVPINDLGTGFYLGSQGGIYPRGSNVLPPSHFSAGLFAAVQVVPRDGQGSPSSTGKIGLLTIGMSNTQQESAFWGQMIASDSAVNPKLVFVNGAQGGQTAQIIADEFGAGAQFWANVNTFVANKGLTNLQVQAVWLKEANANPSNGWPAYAQGLRNNLITICGIINRRFPLCQLCYVASRTYGGYATTSLNPEPYAYQSGFSVKWLIESQINGNPLLAFGGPAGTRLASTRPRSPWLAWGPYFWADGITPRSDGLTWVRPDFGADGTHPSTQGAAKVAGMLMQFFKTDPTTRTWFLANP